MLDLAQSISEGGAPATDSIFIPEKGRIACSFLDGALTCLAHTNEGHVNASTVCSSKRWFKK